MLSTVLLYPRLREFVGHNPAMVETLIHSLSFKKNEFDLTVNVSKKYDNRFMERFENTNVSVSKYSKTVFYKHLFKIQLFSELQLYIHCLSAEYIEFIRTYNSQTGAESGLFWFHTLNWEHAYSLALAIQIVQRETRILCRFVIGLMYQPSKQLVDTSASERYAFNNEIAFRILAKNPHTQFAAADAEIATKYKSIVDRDISIHPCILLGGVREFVRLQSRPVNSKRFLLYTGDAKPNKGFLELPNLAEKILSSQPQTDIKFVVQYTLSTENTRMLEIANVLKDLQLKYPNLEIIDRFLSQHDIFELFDVSSAILFNYDEKVYQHQSSGVLWLASYFDLSVISLSATWIERECARLGADYTFTSTEQLSSLISQKTNMKKKRSSDDLIQGNSYRNQIFEDLGTWIKRV